MGDPAGQAGAAQRKHQLTMTLPSVIGLDPQNVCVTEIQSISVGLVSYQEFKTSPPSIFQRAMNQRGALVASSLLLLWLVVCS
jgi:hypothetical protein